MPLGDVVEHDDGRLTEFPGAEEVPEEGLIGSGKDNVVSHKNPQRVVFVDELPRNAAGQILTRELRDQLRAQASAG